MEEMDENQNVEVDNIPDEYTPISAIGYIGYNILFSIPIIRQILIIVFALGAVRNKNVRSYARSFIIVYLLVFILLAVIYLTIGTSVADMLKQGIYQ